MWFGYVILKIYFASKQALLNDYGLKFYLLSAVHDGVQCGVFREPPPYLRLLHNDKYKAYHFWPENHVLVLVLAYDQVKAIGTSFKR